MKRLLPFLFLVSAACRPVTPEQTGPIVSKIEHFYLVSAQADSLFRFFRHELGLPVVWDYQSFGEFASGGLTLGNVAMEFVYEADDDARLDARFNGIAFEPVADADSAIASLDARGLPHGDPVATRIPYNGEEVVGWVTVGLGGLRPKDANIFICDYKLRDAVNQSREQASKALVADDGGPLGLAAMRELVLGVSSVADASVAWSSLLGPMREDSTYTLDAGPAIRLTESFEEGIRGIVVQVTSLDRAREALQVRGWLDQGSAVRLAPQVVGGLEIRFVE